MDQQLLIRAGVALVALGLLLIFLGALISNGAADAGGVVFVGPIPIVFGSNRNMALIAAVIGLAMVLALHLFRTV